MHLRAYDRHCACAIAQHSLQLTFPRRLRELEGAELAERALAIDAEADFSAICVV